jgi:tetratricopeptide (TPR) repeat protein
LEDDAWERVADMLDLQLHPEEIRSVEAGKARVPGAYVSYAQGLGYLRRNGLENINNAIARFQEAIGRDPSYALPYSGLGSAYALKYEVTKDLQWLELARVNAKRAVDLAPDLAPVHFTLGQIESSTGQDEDAQRELTRALELDPGVIEAHYYLGRLHEREGRLADAERDFRSAVSRRPGYWRGHSELATFYYAHGRLADAEREFLV